MKINNFLPLFSLYTIQKWSACLQEWKGCQHPWNLNLSCIKTASWLWRHPEFKRFPGSFALSLSGEHRWRWSPDRRARRNILVQSWSILPTKSRRKGRKWGRMYMKWFQKEGEEERNFARKEEQRGASSKGRTVLENKALSHGEQELQQPSNREGSVWKELGMRRKERFCSFRKWDTVRWESTAKTKPEEQAEGDLKPPSAPVWWIQAQGEWLLCVLQQMCAREGGEPFSAVLSHQCRCLLFRDILWGCISCSSRLKSQFWGLFSTSLACVLVPICSPSYWWAKGMNSR